MSFKLLLPSILLSLVIGLQGAISYNSLGSTVNIYSRVANETLPNIEHTEEMFLAFRGIRIDLRTLGIHGLTKEQGKKAIEGVLQGIAAYEKAERSYLSIQLNNGEKEKYEKVKKRWTEFKALGSHVLDLYNQDSQANQKEISRIFFEDCPIQADLMLNEITALIDFHKENGQTWSQESKQKAASAKYYIVLMSVVGIAAGLLLACYSLVSINSLMNAIKSTLRNIGQTSQTVSQVSQSLHSSSENLSSSATQQAAAVQQTSSALEETSAGTKRNSESAERSRLLAEESKGAAEKGKASMGEMRASINSIEESNHHIDLQIQESQKEMAEIVKVIHEIGAKTKIINEIVFQTKLLSFNASVEAARAGENGKGFAVVAQEVGNLAQMSGQAAREISMLLEISINKAEEMARSTKERTDKVIDDARTKIDHGNATAQGCDEMLNQIFEKACQLNQLILDISKSSQEQFKGISEINRAIVEVDSGAAKVSSIAMQTSDNSQTLNSELNLLTKELEKLELIVGLSSKDEPAVRPRAA